MRGGKQQSAVFTRRALVAAGVETGLLGLLGTRLYRLQVTDGQRYATLAHDNRVSARLVAPPRGEIHDRFGTLLAGNKPHWRALLMVEKTADAKASVAAFAALIPLDATDHARIQEAIANHRPFIPVLLKDYLSWDEMARLAVHAPNLPGILVDVGTTRLYPFEDAFAHFIGYVGPPGESAVAKDPVLALPGIRIGKTGVERAENQPLTGEPGLVKLEVNALGRVIRDLEREPGTPGEIVRLAADAHLQQLVVARLEKEESASAVVLALPSGAVMALASTPSFNPTLFDTGVSHAQWQEWITDEHSPLLNKAIAGLYAPGSTFKPVVALAGLSSGAIKPTTRFFCPGYLEIGKQRFWCWDHGGHGSLDLKEAIAQSCDVYFYHVALATGIDRIAAMAHRMGIGVTPKIDLPGATAGFVPTRGWREAHGKPWTVGYTVISGIGQGWDLVSPLELAIMVARVATGLAVQANVTATVGKEELPFDPPASLGIAEPDLAAVRAGMRAAVNSPVGTAYASRLSNVVMAGKTGTAQVFNVSESAQRGQFNTATLPWKLRPNALFIAFAPADAPRYAVAVVVEHGNEGADAAAPIAHDIMEAVLKRDPAAQDVAPGGAPPPDATHA